MFPPSQFETFDELGKGNGVDGVKKGRKALGIGDFHLFLVRGSYWPALDGLVAFEDV